MEANTYPLYNVAAGTVYEFDGNVAVSKGVVSTHVNEVLATIVAPKTITIVVPGHLRLSRAYAPSAEGCNLAGFLNFWNLAFKRKKTPIIFRLGTDGQTLTIRNTASARVCLYSSASLRFAALSPNTECEVPVGALVGDTGVSSAGGSGDATDEVVVLRPTPVVQIEAHLYHKNNKGSYKVSEEIVVPPGIYANLSEFAAALNRQSTLRGVRNGSIYTFEVVPEKGRTRRHKGPPRRLQITATHRQPKPSELTITPLAGAFIGLTEAATIPLRTRGRTRFPATCPLIVGKPY